MDNYDIAKHFSLLSKLMDIHGENSFKSKTYSIAAYKIEQLPEELQTLPREKIFEINGIGEAIGKKIIELLDHEKMKTLEDLLAKTPEGILEMMNIKGLGPKKIAVIWKEMNVENIGELLYACHENRLSLLKGFGSKTQQNVIDSIEFFLKQKGNYLYADAEKLADELKKIFTKLFNDKQIEVAGAIARQAETIDQVEFVIPLDKNTIAEKIQSIAEFKIEENSDDYILYKYNEEIKVKLYPTRQENYSEVLFEKTNTPEFNKAFYDLIDRKKIAGSKDQKEIFTKANLPYIHPCLRESGKIIELAKENKIPELIQPKDIKGIVHCHSNWSDGSDKLEALAKACIDKGFEYLVISDHSKSAFYAQGLSEEKIREQHRLVDELNEKLTPFKIFKSIESDILNDGSLDYSDNVLSTFDLIIASVHSNLKMTEDKAMMRLIKAIENPYTTILGHMTGRLLLSRKGYPVDHKKIIDACAANNVVIEINAHPRRLDMAWQWLDYALSKKVLLSINPDSHTIDEFYNTRYGVLAAQKGMLTAKNNLSSFSLSEFENFIKQKKNKKS